MANQIKSMRGVDVTAEFTRQMADNADVVALGNAMLNARGDQLDRLGNVVKTSKEIAAEYHRSEKSVKQVSIKSLDSELFQTPAEAMENLKRSEKARNKAAEDKFGAPALTPVTASATAGPAKRKLTGGE